MNRLKNIVFDLGGVLINLDFARTTNAFKELGFPHFEKMFSQFKADQLFEKLETGKITDEEFYSVLKGVGNKGITPEDIKLAWNAMLLDFRQGSLDFLKTLHENYRLFLLSNTNAIHFTAFNSILKKQTGVNSLDAFFSKTWYSHLLGLRKPNEDIFDFILKAENLQVKETVFIDDTIDNIVTAKKMGFKTHHLLPGETIERLDFNNL